ncbi:MAG: tetratricopeptide repeat protein [Pseudomonadales bacterium]|nr:tetratricopeptide repeat protein [Pseudomonadales bacterium]
MRHAGHNYSQRVTARRLAVVAGLLAGLISTQGMALRNGYSDSLDNPPSIVPAPEEQTKETVHNPEFAPLYYNSGNALYDKGEYLKAIQSYNNALFLEPDMEFGYYNRGMSYYMLRQYKAAAEDFAAVRKQNPNNTYAQIWEKVSLFKYGVAAETSHIQIKTSDESKKPFLKSWPLAVLAFLNGEITEQVLQDAAYHPNVSTQNEQYCELWFYVGQRRLAQGRKQEAIIAFKKSIETDVRDFVEYIASGNELAN